MNVARRAAAAAGVAAVLAVPALVVSSAQATVLDRGVWQDAGQNQFSCSVDVVQDWTARGVFLIKGGRGGDPMPYLLDQIRAHSVFTSPDAPGRWYTVDQEFVQIDTKITQVDGDIYTIDSQLVGNGLFVRDETGLVDAAYHDSGRLLFRAVIDTKGTADPDDDELVSGALLDVNGPHPVLFSGLELCDLADELLG